MRLAVAIELKQRPSEVDKWPLEEIIEVAAYFKIISEKDGEG